MKCTIKIRLRKDHKINLNECAKILLVFHFLFFGTVILDLAEPLEISRTFWNIGLICQILNSFIEYAPDMSESGTVITSLLVVWTFVTAVMIFYMEKKDLLYCGMRQWEIALFDLGRCMKRSFFVLFFTELLVMVAAPFIHLPLTITYFCILYPITAACILAFVGWVTGDAAMEERYISLVKNQCRYDNPVSGKLDKDIPALYGYLKKVPDFADDDWDRVLKILMEVFVRFFDRKNVQKRLLSGERLYEIVRYILSNCNDMNAKKDFLRKLAGRTEIEIRNSRHCVDILTALLLPAVEIKNNVGCCYYITALSAIEDDDIRQELLVRGVVYTYYLDYLQDINTGQPYNSYSSVRNELINRAAEADREKNKSYAIHFALQMKELYPKFKYIFTDIAELL